MGRVSDAYGKAEGQLLTGRGNLLKQVGGFKNPAPAIKDALPGYFVEKADLEIDYIPVEQSSLESDAETRRVGTNSDN